jgi:HK97 gp10 family phage protein
MSQLSFDDFLNRVKKADRKLLKELEQMLIRSALRMERDAKINATSYPKVQTGRLRSSITGLVDAPLGSPRVVLRAGGSSSGSDVDYAEYVEFGTRYIKPRLFLGRAVRSESERLPDRLSSLLSVALGAD